MKQTYILLISLLIAFSNSYAHEEPSKILKEKKEKEEKRLSVLQRKIKSVTVWKHAIVNEAVDKEQKEKFITTKYNKNGNISAMLIYKSTDSLDYKVVFTYDDNNNIITDTDYNPDGSIYENIKYTYDNMGRVTSQLNYTSDGSIDSKFTYVIDNDNNQLLFNKYKPLNSIEYQIIYKYSGNPDESNNIEIVKQTAEEKLIMRVENIFNEKNQRILKKIFNENDKQIYYFKYSYDEKTNNNSIIEKNRLKEKH